jgi:hypothetical protein
VLSGQLRHGQVRQSPYIDKFIKRTGHSCRHRITVIRPEREPGDMKSRSVMMFEKSHHQAGNRMLTKISGKIADSDFAVPRILGYP